MLKQLRQTVIQNLWNSYRASTAQIQSIEQGLCQRGIIKPALDHFAIIDLPGPHTGIPHLAQIFSAIGYLPQGRDYLADKQNEFLWMAEVDSIRAPAKDVLPQVVVADFWLDELPPAIRKIIEKYSSQAAPSPVRDIHKLSGRAYLGDMDAAKQIAHILSHYFSGRDWPLPTVNEFNTVKEFNELLAWVLVFGRRPNHFTLSVHLMPGFLDLAEFHRFIEDDVQLKLNREGGVMKGGAATGIAQGSTTGITEKVKLADGDVELPTGFVEFVWRYPQDPSCTKPVLWDEYFTGFIAQHANRVIESLYVGEEAR